MEVYLPTLPKCPHQAITQYDLPKKKLIAHVPLVELSSRIRHHRSGRKSSVHHVPLCYIVFLAEHFSFGLLLLPYLHQESREAFPLLFAVHHDFNFGVLCLDYFDISNTYNVTEKLMEHIIVT